MHLLYVVASYALFLALLPVLLFHPKLRHGIPFRLGWYRRSFDLPRSDDGRRISIEFEGVFRDSTVFVTPRTFIPS